jgi:ribosomal subunit interface protein
LKIGLTGRRIDVGERLRRHVETRLNDGVGKYFDHAMDSHVVFEPDGKLVRADISVHVGRGIQAQSHGSAEDAQTAFDLAMERIAKRLRRNKRRLRDHHRKSGSARREEALTAQHVILADPADQPDDEAGGENPVIVAETIEEIESMTVSEAVMRLDLAEQPVVVFRNAANGSLNVIYRRGDGNLGWLDPAGADKAEATPRRG